MIGMDGDSTGVILSSSEDIAEKILRYLDHRQLNTCARVCSTWCAIVKRLKRSRTEFSHCFETKPVSDSCEEPSGVISEKVASRFLAQLRGAWCEPGHALVFATGSRPTMYNSCTDDILQVKNAVSSQLPRSCQLLLGRAESVVGTPRSVPSGMHDRPTELERGQGLSGLLLPSVLPDGVEVRPFVVTEAHVVRQIHHGVTDDLKRLVGLPVGEELERVKCALFFVGNNLDDSTCCAVCNILDEFMPGRFAVGGSRMDPLLACYTVDYVFCAGLCFLGDRVRAASVVLSDAVRGAQAVETELRRLRTDCGFGGWKAGATVGLVFADAVRGAEWHGAPNVEADAFARVFPGVPLAGLFGTALVGSQCLVNWYTPDYPKTVFVLLGLGGK
ncbi:F-box only protein 22 isoform X2 [Ixodes scapularis]|uniref:F-box only protein 22 isoform X2 n=1 Tax=Ixodes scapularis TaxID=6945 RepID=UPI001C390934|nr:F-box only protein 22 isoform X2 [Ixodes scapularis]